MCSPDKEGFENFESKYREVTEDYNTSEYLYFPDYNNQSYTAGYIKFDTLPCRDQFWIPADSYLQIPVKVQSSNSEAPYLTNDPIAWKTSVLSLINGIQINSGSGQTLVNDNSIEYINTIRMLMDTSLDAQYTNMNELGLWKDISLPQVMSSNGPVTGSYYASVGSWNAGLPALANNQSNQFLALGATVMGIPSISGLNSSYNEGFDKRVQFFKANSTFSGGVFSTTLYIPLRYLHPFFAKLDFPLINTRFQINFKTPINNGNGQFVPVTQDCPIMHGPFNSVGAGLPDATLSINGPCYIYYRKITYTAEKKDKVAELLSEGHEHSFDYAVLDVYNGLFNNRIPSTYTDTINPTTTCPLRVWQMLQYPGYFAGNPTGAGSDTIQTLPFVMNNSTSRGNILVNNQRYYDNDLGVNQNGVGPGSSRHDFWQVIDENTIGSGYREELGSLIGYQDFLTNYSFSLYDVSRIKDRLTNPAQAVSLQCNYTMSTGAYGNSDVTYLVERKQVAVMKFNSGDTQIAIGASVS